jgi:hypothetical protein
VTIIVVVSWGPARSSVGWRGAFASGWIVQSETRAIYVGTSSGALCSTVSATSLQPHSNVSIYNLTVRVGHMKDEAVCSWLVENWIWKLLASLDTYSLCSISYHYPQEFVRGALRRRPESKFFFANPNHNLDLARQSSPFYRKIFNAVHFDGYFICRCFH